MNARIRPWLAMAVLAVLSLGVTVFVAQRALADASDVIARGEADLLIGALASDLAAEGVPPDAAALERELTTHAAAGLRYVALVDREGRPVVEAGAATIPEAMRPGQAIVRGSRARVAGMLGPPRRGPRLEGRPLGGPGGAGGPGMFMGIPVLVIEIEPPVVDKLRTDLRRIAIVASIAGVVLLAFAVAWARSSARLDAANVRAAREQRLVALGSMSSVMAHELRNPLASLKGHAQLLAEDLGDLGDPKKTKKAERVVAEAERLELLTTNLLDFVRDGPIERESLAPRDLVAKSIRDLDEARIEVDVTKAPATMKVDAERMPRVIHNLVDNALQAAPAPSKVEVSIASEGKSVLVVVRDHGPGIPEDALAQIFEPFHTTRTKGTGLGLAVARRIAEQHGGTLTAERAAEGDGAVFRLTFPGDP